MSNNDRQAHGAYRTVRPRDAQQRSGGTTQQPEPDAALPTDWQQSVRTDLPHGVRWAKRLESVHEAARTSGHYVGSFLTGYNSDSTSVRVWPGDLVLLCTRRQVLRVYIYLPENIWFRTNQDDVSHQSGWPRLLRQHCRGWAAMSRSQRILRACNEAVLDLDRGIDAAQDDLADSRAFRQARDQFERIAGRVTGDLTELTHAGILASMNAWIGDIANSASADRDIVLTVLAEALERESQVETEIQDGGHTLTPEDPLAMRLATVYTSMVRLNLTPGDMQRLFDLMDRGNTLEDNAAEAADRVTLGAAFGGGTRARTPVLPPRRRPVRRRSTDTTVPAATDDVAATAETTPQAGAFNRLARNIRIRQRRNSNDDD